MDWIKCSDRMPEIKENEFRSDDVLTICISHGQVDEFGYPQTYKKGEKYMAIDCLVRWSDKEIVSFRGDRFFGEITHWMPLPEIHE